ncbi:MAG: hypothetical protein WKH68_12665 [Candidatus Limnocylindria bacterium]
MTNGKLIRTTLDAIDTFVADLQRGLAAPSERTALVVDVGRAAATWTVDLDVDGRHHRLDLLVMCEVTDSQVTDARLYVGAPPTNIALKSTHSTPPGGTDA